MWSSSDFTSLLLLRLNRTSHQLGYHSFTMQFSFITIYRPVVINARSKMNEIFIKDIANNKIVIYNRIIHFQAYNIIKGVYFISQQWFVSQDLFVCLVFLTVLHLSSKYLHMEAVSTLVVDFLIFPVWAPLFLCSSILKEFIPGHEYRMWHFS